MMRIILAALLVFLFVLLAACNDNQNQAAGKKPPAQQTENQTQAAPATMSLEFQKYLAQMSILFGQGLRDSNPGDPVYEDARKATHKTMEALNDQEKGKLKSFLAQNNLLELLEPRKIATATLIPVTTAPTTPAPLITTGSPDVSEFIRLVENMDARPPEESVKKAEGFVRQQEEFTVPLNQHQRHALISYMFSPKEGKTAYEILRQLMNVSGLNRSGSNYDFAQVVQAMLSIDTNGDIELLQKRCDQAQLFLNGDYTVQLQHPCPLDQGQPVTAATTISPQGLLFLGELEGGFREYAYNDFGDNDPRSKCTIGYGQVLFFRPCTQHETQTIRISEEEARRFFDDRARTDANRILELVSTPLNQHQLDALVAFHYNLGTEILVSSDGKLLALLNEGRFPEVPAEMRLYNKSEGAFSQGVQNRRCEEADLFEKADYVVTYAYCPRTD